MLTTSHDIRRAARALRDGALVAFPTETVYGLGANALDIRAVAKIFEAKDRPRFDPLIVHVHDVDAARELLVAPPNTFAVLAEAFWPGPLTIVAAKRDLVPDLVTAGQDTVAVRIPAHPIALELLREALVPIAAPSANRFGSISPTTAAHVEAQLGSAVGIILDGGACEVGVESTIVSLAGATPVLLRPGGIPLEAIQRLIGPVTIPAPDEQRTRAPGRLSRHYAPKTPFFLADGNEPRPSGRVGLLTLEVPTSIQGYEVVEVLSPTGDLPEAAQRLFAAMRRLDGLELDAIVATPVREVGLGRAIMDRLRRAAAPLPNIPSE